MKMTMNRTLLDVLIVNFGPIKNSLSPVHIERVPSRRVDAGREVCAKAKYFCLFRRYCSLQFNT